MNLKEILDNIQYIWPLRKTLWGLIAINITIVVLAIAALSLKIPFLSDIQQFQYIVIITFVIILIHFIWWRYYSGREIFKHNGYTVVFCIQARDTKAQKHICTMFNKLYSKLDELGLRDKIKIVSIGQDILNNKKQAEKYKNEFNIDLIIRGELLSGTRKSKEFATLKIEPLEYRIPTIIIDGNLTNFFKNDINISLLDRDWDIDESNNLSDTEKISTNFVEIILFIIGLIYAQTYEHGEDAINIFENLYSSIKTQAPEVIIPQNITNIEMPPQQLLKGRILDILLRIYDNLTNKLIYEEKYLKAKGLLEKYLRFNGNNIDVLGKIALTSFHLGDINAAKKYTEDIHHISPKHGLYIVNKGFFNILDKNYNEAVHLYEHAITNEISGELITQVICFLDERKKEDDQEIAYDFAIGLLNYRYIDKKIGLDELRAFRKKAKHLKNKTKYEKMSNFVDSILNSNSKKKKRGK